MRYFAVKNWSRYSRLYADDKDMLFKYKRIILLSQFTLIGSIVGVLHSLEDLVDGMLFMPAMDFIMASFIFACYLLNENGRHRLSRIALLTFLNLYFFIYSSLVPPGLGIYLYYFPWIGLAAVVFESNENALRFSFIISSVALLLVLFATNFNILGIDKFDAVDIERSFIINMVSSIAVLVFFIAFMVRVNESSESKLHALAEEVRMKNAFLEKTNKELDRFFYSTSHDLKYSLMNIKGILNNAMAEPQTPAVMECFSMLKESTIKLEDFLRDLIEYSRNSQSDVKVEPVDIRTLADEVVAKFAFVPGADKIKFEKEIHIAYPVETDKLRLTTILTNLVANSIKYHREYLKDPWIRISAHYTNEKLSISVSDNGQGIERDVLPKIFNMFYKGTNKSKGAGLGLYIVKETVEKLKGGISVLSEVNRGTAITIILPTVLLQHITTDMIKAVSRAQNPLTVSGKEIE